METSENKKQEEKNIVEKSISEKEREDIMCGNPFLFKEDKKQDIIYSIEDFYVQYKDNYIKFEDVVRSDEFSSLEKKKIINNQLSIWQKAAEKEIYKVFKESKDAVLRCRRNKLNKMGFKYFFMLFLGIIIPVVLLLNIIPIIDFTNQYCVISGVGIIVLSMTGLVCTIVQNHLQNKFARCFHKHMRTHEKLSKSIYKKLKKNCKIVKKYYTKNFEEQMFTKDSLELEKISYVSDKLSLLQESTTDIHQQYTKVMNKGKGISGLYIIAAILSYFVSISSIVGLIVTLIINLINK